VHVTSVNKGLSFTQDIMTSFLVRVSAAEWPSSGKTELKQ